MQEEPYYLSLKYSVNEDLSYQMSKHTTRAGEIEQVAKIFALSAVNRGRSLVLAMVPQALPRSDPSVPLLGVAQEQQQQKQLQKKQPHTLELRAKETATSAGVQWSPPNTIV